MPAFSPVPTRLSYRPDIDGLRALAVLMVMLNHFGVRGASGGYVGVDVFFVISGYLIGALVLKDALAGEFSFRRFYIRRFRRIVPALTAMLLAASITAYLVFFPRELHAYARTELGALFSVSNIVFARQEGYFETFGDLRPLLHTWSLAVEEQFYVVFPALLLLLVRSGAKILRPALWTLTVALLAFQIAGNVRTPDSAYFLAPFRAGEFLLGVLLAARALPVWKFRWQREILAVLGITLLAVAGWNYHRGPLPPFATPPPWFALPPSLGTLMLLSSGEGEGSTVNRVLAWTPLRWLGLISYSTYLWHYPLYVFQRMDCILVPDRFSPLWTKAALLGASIVLGTLSWWLIEQPFRVGRLRSKPLLFAIQGALIVILACFGWELVRTNGWAPSPAVESGAQRDYRRAIAGEDTRFGTCFLEAAGYPGGYNKQRCIADGAPANSVLVLGDSHAAFFFAGLAQAFPERQFTLASAPGCSPAMAPPKWGLGWCASFSRFVFGDLLVQHKFGTVALVKQWRAWDFDALHQTIDWLRARGIKVVVFGPTVEYDASLLRLVEISKREADPGVPARHRSAEAEALDKEMKRMARDVWHVPYVSTYDDLCNPELVPAYGDAAGCPVFGSTGSAILWDDDHFTPGGARLFASQVRSRGQLP